MNRLKELRKQHWLTLDDVEEELGIGRGTYIRLASMLSKARNGMKVELFCDSNIAMLQEKMNEWLTKNKVAVVDIKLAPTAYGVNGSYNYYTAMVIYNA